MHTRSVELYALTYQLGQTVFEMDYFARVLGLEASDHEQKSERANRGDGFEKNNHGRDSHALSGTRGLSTYDCEVMHSGELALA